jgi:hypothetical protein
MSQPLSVEEPEYAAFIAIDWADREHAWALQVAGSTQRECGKLRHTPEDIEAWARQWAQRFAGRPVAVALEQSRGALLYALSKYSHLVLFPIHPSTSYDYRKAVFPSGSKDDPRDAEVLLDLLTLHRDRLRVLKPDTEPTRQLQALVEKRRQLVDERTAQTNRITGQLKLYFPQILDWFDNLSAPLLAAFLQRWPTLPQLQAEEPEVVRAFFRQHGSRSQTRIEQRLRQMQQARPATCDAAVVEPSVLMVRTLLAIVAVLNEGIRALDKSIQTVASTHPDYAIFSSFPAAGSALAPRLLAAFGSRRERFASAHELQSFSGIAPVMQASGKQRWVHSGGPVPNSCGRPSMNTLPCRPNTAVGPALSTKNKRLRERDITPPCAPWPSSGFASCSAAGSPVRRIRKNSFWPRVKPAPFPSLASLRPALRLLPPRPPTSPEQPAENVRIPG